MALQISGTTVVDNSRNLTNIATFDSTITSTWDQVTTTAVNKTLGNREWCTVTTNNVVLTLPGVTEGGSYFQIPSGWEIQVSVGNFTNTAIVIPTYFVPSMVFNGTIMGVDTFLIIDRPYMTITLNAENAANGNNPTWRIK